MPMIDKCRMCKSEKLHNYLDLGFHPHSDGFLTELKMNSREVCFPLRVCLCADCGLHQLDYVVAKEDLYNEDYLYESSISSMGKAHYFNMAESICREIDLPESGLVVDIGSNVGVLLEGFQKQGMEGIGVDPAPKLAEIANQRGIETINAFFNEDIVEQIIERKGQAVVVTGTNVFAHIDDLDELMCGVQKLLIKNGTFVFELPYLLEMIEHMEYDTIYHQHLSYISIKPLIPFFAKYNLEIFHVEMEYYIHGGSIRFYVGEKNKRPVSPIIGQLLKTEEVKGLYDLARLKKFADDVAIHRIELMALLIGLKKRQQKVVGIGAAAKGNTLLNYCGIHNGILDYITEKSTLKTGRYSPGLHIPVVSDDRLLVDKPQFGLILPWNLADEIMKNLSEFAENGGRFIIPIPQPKIV